MRRNQVERRSRKYAPVQNVSMDNWYMDATDFNRKHKRSAQAMSSTSLGKNRIMIFGPKQDGTYVIEFRTAKGETLAIPIPRTDTAVIEHFQKRMSYGLFVPELPPDWEKPDGA